jgi:hypothetical protein
MSNFANSTANQMRIDKKVLFAVIGFLVAAVIGITGFVAAAPEGKPTKEECAATSAKNYGQCVKVWAQSKGYGG